MRPSLRIVTRGSKLALAQTSLILGRLQSQTRWQLTVESVKTYGDQHPRAALNVGTEVGMFTRALEQKLLEGRADLAVHSFKDLPLLQPEGLAVVAVAERNTNAEALVVCSDGVYEAESPLSLLKAGAVLATGSPRRVAIVKSLRPDINIQPLRGNLTTRLDRLKRGDYDATICSLSGLLRLNIADPNLNIISLPTIPFVPAPAQGAVAVQMRRDAQLFKQCAELLNDEIAMRCCAAERLLLKRFGGGCALPLGASVKQVNGEYHMHGFWASPAGPRWTAEKGQALEPLVDKVYQNLISAEPIP